ncbi:DNA polymerase Y family protein [Streptomyces sp. NPDC003860]
MILYVHFAVRDFQNHEDRFEYPGTEAVYRRLVGLLGGITPVVQALPPDAAFADVAGARRYFGRDARDLAALVRLRVAAVYGIDCTVGVGPNPLLARIAAQSGPPGAIRCTPTDPAEVAAYLAPMPVGVLPGVGPATVRTLAPYGLHTVGDVQRVPTVTLGRILGAPAARALADAARGIDATRVAPTAPPRSVGAVREFGRDELDPEQHHRALLGCAEEIGWRLRRERQVAGVLVLTVSYADRTTTVRTRTLPEPTAHSRTLATEATRMHASLALQRARVRGITLRAEAIAPADRAVHQLTLDPTDDRAHRLEAAADRARARFGPDAVSLAALGTTPTPKNGPD